MLISWLGARLRRILHDRHALFDDALHAQQAHAELLLNQLADAAHAAVAQVVDIVCLAVALVELHHAAQDRHHVILGERADRLRNRQIELAVELIASHAAQVIAAWV